ncbi:hypothetical protein PRIPAC_82777 [Pristionchus pacificus]|uniref:Cytochrome P450 n=1 Tax=Pristionchus pacificus TaxID=54126 RepID=A0A2A6CMI4_PRIPA|nr:hypothetical protein PRIPAC_82777 [Pristionchus pacificus]|eukprot:PDM79455.1 cytochrome P450 [Pristionchus pacificus]
MIGVLVVIALLTLIIQKVLARRKYLQLREELGLTGPPTNFIFGNLLYMFRVIKEKGVEASPTIYPELVKKYGSTFGFECFISRQRLTSLIALFCLVTCAIHCASRFYFGAHFDIVTVDPHIIKEIFISQFGNFVDRRDSSVNTVYPFLDGLIQVGHVGSYGAGWKEIRSVISVIFTSASMKKMHLMFHDQLDNLLDVLTEKSRKNNGITDIYGEYQAMTMDMIARCALGQNLSCLKDRDNDYYTRARTFFANIQFQKSTVFQLTVFMPIFRYLRRFTTFGRAERYLVGLLSESVHERERERAAGIIRPLPDAIDLILAENEKRKLSGMQPLHHEVIVCNAWALFIAGYETTSTALAYATFLLAKHPEVQATLHEEVLSTFGDNDTIDYERVMKLPYLHAVFAETVRLYPPVTTLTGRQCIKETVIGGRIRVPVGCNVMTPVHAVHWSEENYDRPREFCPERFLDDGKPAWSATYMPFGIGPRNCVGARFAEMEFKTVMSAVIRKFIIELHPAHTELKTMTANILQNPINNELFVRLVERK